MTLLLQLGVVVRFQQEHQKMAETRKPNKPHATHPKGHEKGSFACRVTGHQGGVGSI